MNKLDLAKFFSGFAVAKIIFHAVLARSDVLPLTLVGFTLTPQYNFGIIILWVAVATFLVHYAWFKK